MWLYMVRSFDSILVVPSLSMTSCWCLYYVKVLACIGEVLEEDDNDICGCVVNVRKSQDKLCLWTRDADNKESIVRIGYVQNDVDLILLQTNFEKSP
jgi:hypothetical protein